MALYRRKNPKTGNRSRVWRGSFRFNGRHYDLSTNCTTKPQAKTWVTAFKNNLALGQVGIVKLKDAPTFKEFAERFREHVRTVHAGKPKTVTFYENSLDRLLEFDALREVHLDKVDEALIASYVAKRKSDKKRVPMRRSRNGKKKQAVPTLKPLQVATINAELRTLRKLLGLALEWKIVPTVPKVRMLQGEHMRDRVLTPDEEQTYIKAAPQPLCDIATVLSQTGLRPEEVFRMRFENLHFTPAGNASYGYILNPFGKTKAAKRTIPLTDKAQRVLEARSAAQGNPNTGWVFPAATQTGRVESVKGQHAKTLKASKVRPFVLYTFRHTFLTRLGESGADPFTIQKIAGHSSIAISARYVHPTPETVERAFSRFEQLSSNTHETNAPSTVAVRKAG